MKKDEAKQAFVTIQAHQQQRILALLALNLTIAARAMYGCQIDEHQGAEKLCAFNELLHSISGQLVHLIDEDPGRYSDDALIDALYERAEQGNCVADLGDAFNWSFSVAQPNRR
jgi:hypothetical protein